ncbi:Dimethylaniline monooxygenase [N-oxide-forming] 5, partial [Stegodyphus mimosarum]
MIAETVYMSVRTPTWIMTRHGPYGYPLDWSILKWSFAILQNYFPRSICNKVIQEIFIDPRFSHDLYNILPKHGPLDRDFALSDALPSRLMNGAIILKKNINYFTEDGIVFCEEGNTVTSVDIVVLATGYLWGFPFLDSEDLIIQDKIVHLYKCVYPPHLKHPTLGIIGFIVPMGPGFPCVEIQCRWFAHVMSGKSKLPLHKEMLEDVYRQYKDNLKRYGDNSRVSVHIDILPYLEGLASKIGAKPNLFKLLFTDPKLYMACVFGVFLPYRFRLVGPHKWKGAREAILTADKRMRAALQGRRAFDDKYRNNFSQRIIIPCVLVLAWYLWKNNLIPPKFLDFLTRLLVSIYTKALQFSKAEIVILKRFLDNKIVTKNFRASKEYNG